MSDDQEAVLRRENAYLKQRVAQLQADLVDVEAEAGRLREALERTNLRRSVPHPNPLGSGQ